MLMVSLPQEIVTADNPLSYGASSEYTQFGNGKISKFIVSEGRGAAAEVDAWLAGSTRLPSAGGIKPRVCGETVIFGTYWELTLLN